MTPPTEEVSKVIAWIALTFCGSLLLCSLGLYLGYRLNRRLHRRKILKHGHTCVYCHGTGRGRLGLECVMCYGLGKVK